MSTAESTCYERHRLKHLPSVLAQAVARVAEQQQQQHYAAAGVGSPGFDTQLPLDQHTAVNGALAGLSGLGTALSGYDTPPEVAASRRTSAGGFYYGAAAYEGRFSLGSPDANARTLLPPPPLSASRPASGTYELLLTAPQSMSLSSWIGVGMAAQRTSPGAVTPRSTASSSSCASSAGTARNGFLSCSGSSGKPEPYTDAHDGDGGAQQCGTDAQADGAADPLEPLATCGAFPEGLAFIDDAALPTGPAPPPALAAPSTLRAFVSALPLSDCAAREDLVGTHPAADNGAAAERSGAMTPVNGSAAGCEAAMRGDEDGPFVLPGFQPEDLALARVLVAVSAAAPVMPAHALQVLLGFAPEDYQDLAAALNDCGWSSVYLVACYLHNLRTMATPVRVPSTGSSAMATPGGDSVGGAAGGGGPTVCDSILHERYVLVLRRVVQTALEMLENGSVAGGSTAAVSCAINKRHVAAPRGRAARAVRWSNNGTVAGLPTMPAMPAADAGGAGMRPAPVLLQTAASTGSDFDAVMEQLLASGSGSMDGSTANALAQGPLSSPLPQFSNNPIANSLMTPAAAGQRLPPLAPGQGQPRRSSPGNLMGQGAPGAGNGAYGGGAGARRPSSFNGKAPQVPPPPPRRAASNYGGGTMSPPNNVAPLPPALPSGRGVGAPPHVPYDPTPLHALATAAQREQQLLLSLLGGDVLAGAGTLHHHHHHLPPLGQQPMGMPSPSLPPEALGYATAAAPMPMLGLVAQQMPLVNGMHAAGAAHSPWAAAAAADYGLGAVPPNFMQAGLLDVSRLQPALAAAALYGSPNELDLGSLGGLQPLAPWAM